MTYTNPADTVSVDVDRVTHYFAHKANSIAPDPFGFVGYYALQCTLPRHSDLFHYSSGELAETTDHNE